MKISFVLLTTFITGTLGFQVACAQAAQQELTQPSSALADLGAPDRLTSSGQLLLVRDVGGEFAKVVRPIPLGKKGFKMIWGNAIDSKDLSDALRLYGTAANSGDVVQITGLDFHGKTIRVEIDGGGKSHFNWRQHLQVGMGNLSLAQPDTKRERATGGVLILEFENGVPNLNAEELKRGLGSFLDFSKHSASTNWIDTLPTAFRNAIQSHQAVVGMDSEMVIAAMGLPDKKVRQWDKNGNQTEDWIYGVPPAPTTFVTFNGSKVSSVKKYAIGQSMDDTP